MSWTQTIKKKYTNKKELFSKHGCTVSCKEKKNAGKTPGKMPQKKTFQILTMVLLKTFLKVQINAVIQVWDLAISPQFSQTGC